MGRGNQESSTDKTGALVAALATLRQTGTWRETRKAGSFEGTFGWRFLTDDDRCIGGTVEAPDSSLLQRDKKLSQLAMTALAARCSSFGIGDGGGGRQQQRQHQDQDQDITASRQRGDGGNSTRHTAATGS
jgi:hypothetical protein